mgnify:FL=1
MVKKKIAELLANSGFGKAFLKNQDTTIKSVRPGVTFPGQKTVAEVKSGAAKSKLKMVKDKLDQTFQGSDKALNKLKKTIKTLKGK